MIESIWNLLSSLSSAVPGTEVWDLFVVPLAERGWFRRGFDWLVNSLTDPKRFLQFSFGILVFGMWIIWWRKK